MWCVGLWMNMGVGVIGVDMFKTSNYLVLYTCMV